MAFFLFLFLYVMHPTPSMAWSQPNFNSCDFYLDAESSLRCNGQGSNYLLDYGFYYCKKFKENSVSWSKSAAKWANSTGQCLQEMLFDNKENRLSSCPQLEEFAFDTHPICYKQYGFCSLGIADKFKIFSTIRAVDLISRKSLTQSINVLLACGKELWLPAEEATFQKLVNISVNYTISEKAVAEQIFIHAPSESKALRNRYFTKALSLILGFESEDQQSANIEKYLKEFSDPDLKPKRSEVRKSGPLVTSESPMISPEKHHNVTPDQLKAILGVLVGKTEK